MAALLVVADQYGLNPFTREIFAFPDKQNGVVPVVSVDGWARIINEHAAMNGVEFNWSPDSVAPEGGKLCPEWCEAVFYRKDRDRPTVVREYLDEVYRPPFKGQYGPIVGPWQTHTKRFLRHKTFIQGARIAFGFAGIFDEDEAVRIVEGETIPAEASRGEPTPAETGRAALPHLPADQFETQLKSWVGAIESGRMDAESVIAMAGSKYALTEAQRVQIRAAGEQPEAEPEIVDSEWIEQFENTGAKA